MKITHLSYSDLQGGAARASFRIHQAMRTAGIDSRMLVQKKLTDQDRVIPIAAGTRFAVLGGLLPYLDRAPLAFYGLNPKGAVWHPGWLNPFRAHQHRHVQDADAVMLYWVCNGFLGIRTIARLLALRKPVLWRLSDMWPFTGGCHYSGACQRFRNRCGRCPQLDGRSSYDLSRRVYRSKVSLWRLAKNPWLTIVSPSRWIAKHVAQSSLFAETPQTIIPTGVDTRLFKPIPTELARNILNLPPKKKLILFGADKALTDQRKGGQLLPGLLKTIDHQGDCGQNPPEIVVFGSWRESESTDLPIKMHALGQFTNDRSLPLVYSACDVFVSLALEDNLPNTIIEAMACGTPCVAFKIGGIPELIDHQTNGYLASKGAIADVAAGIGWVLKHNRDERRLSRHACLKIQNDYDLSDSIRKYQALINDRLEALG